MNEQLEKAWDTALANPGTPVDIGDNVVCDSCNADFTNRNDEGGLLFESKGICPACTPEWEKSALHYGEEHLIRARAKPGQSFKDFILELRAGNNSVVIMKGKR